HQNGIADAVLDAFGKPGHVGDEQIIANELTLGADEIGEDFPALPIVFRHTILDGYDWVAPDKISKIFGLLLPRTLLALALVDISAVFVEFGRCAIERQHHIAARLVAGLADRLHDKIERGLR